MVESRLLNYIKNAFPDREGLGIRNLQNISTGWETEILSFDLEWIKSGNEEYQKLIVRIYPGKNAVSKAQKEAHFMKGVRELNYPVPVVHILETDLSHIGKPFMIMDRIDGGTLDSRLRGDTERWTNEFHRLFVILHRLDWKRLHPCPETVPVDDPYYYVKLLLADQEKQIQEYQKPELSPIIEWMRKRKNDVPCNQLSIVHRDFHTQNILVDNKEKSYVIDWGAAGIADFRVDLAWTLLLSFAYNDRELRDRILKGYENELGDEVEMIEYFEVLATLRRILDVTSSFDLGAVERGLRPEAVEMMKETAGHVVRVRDRLEEISEIRIPEIDQFISSLTE